MRSRWPSRSPARQHSLEALVARSRLIGEEESLGLFGGGNTSTKGEAPDLLGRPQVILWVKGSGSDLKGCEARHFAPLRLEIVRRLAGRTHMSDEEMMAFLERCVVDPKAPRPSVETLLHAFLPERDIDHTHADAILALANNDRGERLVRQALGEQILWIPYIQPGFALSKRVFEAYQRQPSAHGAVLEKHGLITWGPDGRTSYLRTIRYVSMAERFLARHRRRLPVRQAGAHWLVRARAAQPRADAMEQLRQWVPVIRRVISRQRKMCVSSWQTPEILDFVNTKPLLEAARRGPATPDHMLRTKRLPLIIESAGGSSSAVSAKALARTLERYAASHERYFLTYRRPGDVLQDPFPRVMLLPEVGMLTTGQDATQAAMVATIYRHAMAIIRDASSVGRYASVSERQAFGVEYWPLELYKLSLAPPEPELSREIGLLTGAVGGIGRGIAELLVDRGASLIVTDLRRHDVEALAEALNRRAGRRRALGVAMDVTDERSIERACDAALRTFGGLDFLVSNAGIATVASIDRLRRIDWERSLAVNATGHFLVAKAAVRWLRAQGLGGSLVFIASKNVTAPGKEFGAYSAAKAAETQLARVLAIENGEFNIRVNIVNPDGVFEGSGLWRSIAADRARTYRLPPSELETFYQQRNLLKTRVRPSDVAEAVCFLISRRAAKTTGCLLTVDGGLREAFPR